MTHSQAEADAARNYKPLPVEGYKAQPQEAVDLVNELKQAEERALRLLDQLNHKPLGIDGRRLSIGRTHIQQGFMAAARAVFQPARISLPEDNATKED